MPVKISRGEISNLWRSYLQRPAGVAAEGERPRQGEKAAPAQGDTLTLSPQVQEIQRLHQALARVPEVREERVRELAAAVAAGTYEVSPEAVAAQMLRRMLGDRLV